MGKIQIDSAHQAGRGWLELVTVAVRRFVPVRRAIIKSSMAMRHALFGQSQELRQPPCGLLHSACGSDEDDAEIAVPINFQAEPTILHSHFPSLQGSPVCLAELTNLELGRTCKGMAMDADPPFAHREQAYHLGFLQVFLVQTHEHHVTGGFAIRTRSTLDCSGGLDGLDCPASGHRKRARHSPSQIHTHRSRRRSESSGAERGGVIPVDQSKQFIALARFGAKDVNPRVIRVKRWPPYTRPIEKARVHPSAILCGARGCVQLQDVPWNRTPGRCPHGS